MDPEVLKRMQLALQRKPEPSSMQILNHEITKDHASLKDVQAHNKEPNNYTSQNMPSKVHLGPNIGQQMLEKELRNERMGRKSMLSISSSTSSYDSEKMIIDVEGNMHKKLVIGKSVEDNDRLLNKKHLGHARNYNMGPGIETSENILLKRKTEQEYAELKAKGNYSIRTNSLLERDLISRLLSELHACENFITCRIQALMRPRGILIAKLNIVGVDRFYPSKKDVKPDQTHLGMFRSGSDTRVLEKTWEKVRLQIFNPELFKCERSGRKYLFIRYFRLLA